MNTGKVISEKVHKDEEGASPNYIYIIKNKK